MNPVYHALHLINILGVKVQRPIKELQGLVDFTHLLVYLADTHVNWGLFGELLIQKKENLECLLVLSHGLQNIRLLVHVKMVVWIDLTRPFEALKGFTQIALQVVSPA